MHTANSEIVFMKENNRIHYETICYFRIIIKNMLKAAKTYYIVTSSHSKTSACIFYSNMLQNYNKSLNWAGK